MTMNLPQQSTNTVSAQVGQSLSASFAVLFLFFL